MLERLLAPRLRLLAPHLRLLAPRQRLPRLRKQPLSTLSLLHTTITAIHTIRTALTILELSENDGFCCSFACFFTILAAFGRRDRAASIASVRRALIVCI